MLFKKLECFVVLAPKGGKLDSVFLVGNDLSFKLRNVFFSPVVSASFHSQTNKHFSAGFWRPLFRIERDNTPGDQVFTTEVRRDFVFVLK